MTEMTNGSDRSRGQPLATVAKPEYRNASLIAERKLSRFTRRLGLAGVRSLRFRKEKTTR